MTLAQGLVSAVAGGVGGFVADWAAARVAHQQVTARSWSVAAVAGTALAWGLITHPMSDWHGRLMPVWLWGWVVLADVDLRVQTIDDLHMAAVALMAFAAAVLDRQILMGIAGALCVGGMGILINLLRRVPATGWALTAVAAGAGAVTAAGLWGAVWYLTSGPPVREALDSRLLLTLAAGAAVAGFVVWVRQEAEGWKGEYIGEADIILGAVLGLWFGLRWVWWPLGIGTLAAGLMGAGQWLAAARQTGRFPWGERGQATIPGLLVGAALGLFLPGVR